MHLTCRGDRVNSTGFMKSHLLSPPLNSTGTKEALSINLHHTNEVSRRSSDIDVIFIRLVMTWRLIGVYDSWVKWLSWEAALLKHSEKTAAYVRLRSLLVMLSACVSKVFGKRVGKMWPHAGLTHSKDVLLMRMNIFALCVRVNVR